MEILVVFLTFACVIEAWVIYALLNWKVDQFERDKAKFHKDVDLTDHQT